MLEEKNSSVRKRPIALLNASCFESSEDSDVHSTVNSDSSSSCSATDDKRRYCFLKRAARQMVMENYCLAQRLEKMERQVIQVSRERRFLLERLLEHEKKKVMVTKATSKTKPSVIQSSSRHQPLSRHQTLPRQQQSSKQLLLQPLPRQLLKAPVVTPSRIPRQRSPDTDSSGSDHATQPPVANMLSRKKPADRSLPKRIQSIPLKEDGTPVYPINLGGLQVLSLGHVIFDRPAYHTERYILPVGYQSRRSYFSIKEPTSRCMYTCQILDGGEAPTFEVISEEDPSHPIRGTSSSSCHAILLKAINKARGKDATNTGSGPEFFGYSHPVIVNLLQKLPNVSLCTKYKPMKFQEVSRASGSRPSPKNKKSVSTVPVKGVSAVMATSLPNILSSQNVSTLLLTSLKQLHGGAAATTDLQLVSPTHFKPKYHVPSPSSSGSSSIDE